MNGPKNSITFLGDVCIQQPVAVSPAVRLPSEHLVVNLEGPFASKSEGYEPDKILLPSNFQSFVESLGTDLYATLANNHTFDFGVAGFEKTVRKLNSVDVASTGAGTCLSDVRLNPMSLSCGPQKVAIINLSRSLGAQLASNDSFGSAPCDISFLKSKIERAKNAKASRIVLCVHWGDEEVPAPHPEDVSFARQAIDLGVDLIIGHHAHVRQFYESYKGKQIFYGLGNAVFPDFEAVIIRSDGQRTPVYKQQALCNRTSIAVNYDPATEELRLRKLRLNGSRVSVVSEFKPRPAIWLGTGRLYQFAYRIIAAFGKGRYLINKFLARPRIPAPRHIINFFKLITKRG